MKYFNRISVWIGLFCLSFVFALITYFFIPKALPLIHVPITASRSDILSKAQTVAQAHQWGPVEYHQAVEFETDSFGKTFVELEGGGQTKLISLMEHNLYMPYQWRVRHFKEFETHETEIRFLPTGQPYGFRETLAEDENGAALNSIKARTIAEKATAQWQINLSEFSLIETSQETKPSSRIDHTFVYERPEAVEQGRLRLRIVVSGDKVTEITHFIKIPEAFTIRYQEMRSANESIAHAARLAMQLLFIIGGCLIGLLFLFRQHWVIWRSPAYWALFITVLSFFDTINQLPLLWTRYDTALSFTSYLLRLYMQDFFDCISQCSFLLLIFMAGESLTRKAFGNHIQLWKSWTISAASSFQILGRTIGGYLLVSLDFVFVICFYIFTRTFLGWWVPAESLADPNILATYAPWLRSLTMSLRAGFMEECLFRAVPLAAAAIIGRNIGKEKLCIAIAFITQVLIFGAAHAWYPVQPAYARIIELIFTSSLFGCIYLIFGLLPAIISHFIYDAIWTSLPIFLSSAPYAWINQVITIALALIPLWVCLFARYKYGSWHQLGTQFYNKAWQPVPTINKSRTMTERTYYTFNPLLTYSGIALCAIGFLAWILTTPFSAQSPALNGSRSTVINQSKLFFTHNNINITDRYPLSYLFGNFDQVMDEKLQHQFIWQQLGPDTYKKLLGTYLSVPHWTIRFVCFTGTPSERADVYYSLIKDENMLYRVAHQFAEDEPGAQLSQEKARQIAHQALQEKFNMDPTKVNEISATANKLPQRLDWVFIFTDPACDLNKGQARIEITIAGNILADYRRLIHVPETWEREHRNHENLISLLTTICGTLMYGIFIIAASSLLFHLTVPLLKQTAIFFFIFLFLFLINAFNAWPRVIAEFNTSEPFYLQLFRTYGSEIMGILIKAATFALSLLYIFYSDKRYASSGNAAVFLMSIGFGLLAAGIISVLQFFIPSYEPLWAHYTPLAYAFPAFAIIIHTIIQYIVLTLLILIFIAILNTLTRYGTIHRFIALCLSILFGIILFSLNSLDNIPLWLAAGLCLGIITFCAYFLIARFNNGFVPLAIAAFWNLQLVQQALFAAYKGALFNNLLASVIISSLGWYWYLCLNKK